MPDTIDVPDAAAAATEESDLGAYVPTQLPDTFAFRWVVPYLGGWVALVFLPLFYLADYPLGAWAIATGLWLANLLAQRYMTLMTMGLPATIAVGAAGVSMMLRVWTTAIVLFFVGASLDLGGSSLGAGRKDLAVPAMLFFLVLFTFDVAVRSMSELRRYKSKPASAGTPDTREEIA